MHPYEDVPADHPKWSSGSFISNYGLPSYADGAGFPLGCFRDAGASCIPKDKANAILWDFYQVKLVRAPAPS